MMNKDRLVVTWVRIFTCFAVLFFISACTEESRNEIVRKTDNIIGQNLRVSYVDNGVIVKTWTVKDSKITSGKDENGHHLNYYFFWSEETGYVQLPIERTIIEEIK